MSSFPRTVWFSDELPKKQIEMIIEPGKCYERSDWKMINEIIGGFLTSFFASTGSKINYSLTAVTSISTK